MTPHKFKIRQRFHDTDTGQVYSWTAGPPQAPHLVLIHQSGNSSDEYRGLIPFLADKFHLIALDLPGHGRSDDPPSEPGVEDYTRATKTVLDDLNIKTAHILGHHGGCYVAISLLAMEPDRFQKAILSGLGGLVTPEEIQALKDLVLSTDTTVTPEADFMGDAWERYLNMASEGSETMDTLKPFIAFLKARLRPYRGVLVNLKFDKKPYLGKLRGPVLLVNGTKDHFIKEQQKLLPLIANSTRRVMQGFGAFMFYDRPFECAEMIKAYLEA